MDKMTYDEFNALATAFIEKKEFDGEEIKLNEIRKQLKAMRDGIGAYPSGETDLPNV